LRKKPSLKYPLKKFRNIRQRAAPLIPLLLNGIKRGQIPGNNPSNAVNDHLEVISEFLLAFRELALLHLASRYVHQNNLFK
jgi:hypothetical protein